MRTLDDEFDFFLDNHDELFKKYPYKHVVINGGKVVLSDDTFEKALDRAIASGLKVGTFLIQYCTPGEEGYMQSFDSQVVFA